MALPPIPSRKGWSFFATKLNGDGTETELAVDLPLTSPTITEELAAPSAFTARVSPEIQSLKTAAGGPLFSPYSTAIYVEHDGAIRYGFLLRTVEMDNDELRLSGSGFASYLDGLPWTNSVQKFYDTDPLSIVRRVWDYVQSHPRGNLGVTLTPATLTTPARVGVKKAAAATQEAQDEPVLLANYATHNLGEVVDGLLEAGSVDYVERHYRRPDGTIAHELALAHPRMGSRRTDIRFEIGENVVTVPPVDMDYTDYATEVVVLGAGEGDKMIRGHAVNPSPGDGLRRVAVYPAKHIGRTATALSVAASRAKQLQRGILTVEELKVHGHPNAPLFSWGVGDEVRLTGDAGWAGHIDMFVRILSTTFNPTDHANAATLRVTPAGRT